jgi:hypothetical protein
MVSTPDALQHCQHTRQNYAEIHQLTFSHHPKFVVEVLVFLAGLSDRSARVQNPDHEPVVVEDIHVSQLYQPYSQLLTAAPAITTDLKAHSRNSLI